MSSLLRWLPRFAGSTPSRTRTRTLPPRAFTNPNFRRVPPHVAFEEETTPNYVAERYYPVHIGEVLGNAYQVVGKLGYGVFSTVWLARDLRPQSAMRHVTLKVFTLAPNIDAQVNGELDIYQRMEQAPEHPGRSAVRTTLDSFKVDGPHGFHHCLVHPPLWDSLGDFLEINSAGKLPLGVLKSVMQRLLLGLDFLHTNCQIVHTGIPNPSREEVPPEGEAEDVTRISDIKADNIMFGIDDDTIFPEFEELEVHDPCPRKEVDGGRIIYESRQPRKPETVGPPLLCDFGSAVLGDREHSEDVQPDIYRCPEVVLNMPWDYKIDIWNAGCLMWDIYEGSYLFSGHDPAYEGYRGRTHLAEMMALLGPAPKDLLDRGAWKLKYFADDGTFNAGIDLLPPNSFEDRETNLSGEEQRHFLRLIRNMIQWRPEDRQSAAELYRDPWLHAKVK